MCKGAHTGLGTGHNATDNKYSRYEGVKNAGGNVLVVIHLEMRRVTCMECHGTSARNQMRHTHQTRSNDVRLPIGMRS